MPIQPSEVIIDIADPNRAGMYRDFDSEVPTKVGPIVRGNGFPQRVRLVRRNTSDSPGPWEDYDSAGMTVIFAVGEADREPTVGAWELEYDGSSANMDNLAYNISAAALQAALNANANITAAGGVTVEKHEYLFVVTFNNPGARFLLIANVDGLRPQIVETPVTRLVVGDVDNREVQIINLIARSYAFSNVWTPYDVSGFNIEEIQAGSATVKAVRALKFTGKPYAGHIVLNLPSAETIQLTVTSDNTGDALSGKYFVLNTQDGTMGVWFNSTGATSPPAGALSRNLQKEVVIVTGDSASTIATTLAAALTAEGHFTAAAAGTIVTITHVAGGSLGAHTAGDTAFPMLTTQEGGSTTALFSFEASADELQNAINNEWEVSKSGFNFYLTAKTAGVRPAFTYTTDGLNYPRGLEGVLAFNTADLLLAFADSGRSSLTLVYEGTLQEPGELPYTFYRESVEVFKDITAASNMVSAVEMQTLTREGIVSLTAGTDSKAIVYASPLPAAAQAFIVQLLIPAGGAQFPIAVDYSTSDVNGFTVELGADVPDVGYKIYYKASYSPLF